MPEIKHWGSHQTQGEDEDKDWARATESTNKLASYGNKNRTYFAAVESFLSPLPSPRPPHLFPHLRFVPPSLPPSLTSICSSPSVPFPFLPFFFYLVPSFPIPYLIFLLFLSSVSFFFLSLSLSYRSSPSYSLPLPLHSYIPLLALPPSPSSILPSFFFPFFLFPLFSSISPFPFPYLSIPPFPISHRPPFFLPSHPSHPFPFPSPPSPSPPHAHTQTKQKNLSFLCPLSFPPVVGWARGSTREGHTVGGRKVSSSLISRWCESVVLWQ